MHMVKEGFLSEVDREIDVRDIRGDEREEAWYCGYAMGLLMAGYLTQAEHDEIMNEMAKMFKKRPSPEEMRALARELEGR